MLNQYFDNFVVYLYIPVSGQPFKGRDTPMKVRSWIRPYKKSLLKLLSKHNTIYSLHGYQIVNNTLGFHFIMRGSVASERDCSCLNNLLCIFEPINSLKVKTSIGNAPISKNDMEALITNHVKEYVLTNT